jgi:hypothetical protein
LINQSIAFTTTSAMTTSVIGNVVLCPVYNDVCRNQGVCYIVNYVIRCVCPQGTLNTLILVLTKT